MEILKILYRKKCIVGEGPIWNDREKRLYYTNAYGKEICFYNFQNQTIGVRPLSFDVAAFAFSKYNDMIVSHENGVHILRKDDILLPIYDNSKYQIRFANDMKIGPDGRIYVGTQSEKRKGLSERIDGKLYRISNDGEVDVLLNGLVLSNGMEWSIDGNRFYHTDSPTNLIKEYYFNKKTGSIEFTGRQVFVEGVDGFTIDENDNLYVACWGYGMVVIVDTRSMTIVDNILLPCKIAASCCFCGDNMNILAVTTSRKVGNVKQDNNAGSLILLQSSVCGRKPFLFGET